MLDNYLIKSHQLTNHFAKLVMDAKDSATSILFVMMVVMVMMIVAWRAINRPLRADLPLDQPDNKVVIKVQREFLLDAVWQHGVKDRCDVSY